MTMRALPLALLPLIAACASTPERAPLPPGQEAFWDALSSHCGNAYAGGLTSDQEKQRELVKSVPFVTPLELELELRALLPEGYELPKQFCSDEASLV